MPVSRSEIEQLDNYTGSTPMPADFDDFWKARMEEADARTLSYQLSEAEIPDFATCRFRDIWFTGIDGAKIYAKFLKPVSDVPVPLVLQFHGYPGASRSWLEQSSFVGTGCAVIAMDCPGQGGLGQDLGGYLGTTVAGHIVAGLHGDPKNMYYVKLHQNIRILCRIVRELPGIDLERIFVNGASQGGGLGIACAALNNDLINRAAILYPFLSDYRMVWELQADQVAYESLRYYTRWLDPEWKHIDEACLRLGYIDSKNFAHLVRCPVLFGTGLSDNVCPPASQCAVYNNLACPKKRYLYEGFAHEEIQEFDDLILDYFGRKEAVL